MDELMDAFATAVCDTFAPSYGGGGGGAADDFMISSSYSVPQSSCDDDFAL